MFFVFDFDAGVIGVGLAVLLFSWCGCGRWRGGVRERLKLHSKDYMF